MNLKKVFKNRAASSFIEYAIILGVASSVLITMNPYLKRGLQARFKDMTDHFISNEQVVEIFTATDSQSDSISQSDIQNKTFIGGGTRLALEEIKNMQTHSVVESTSLPFFFQPSATDESGEITSPPAPSPESFLEPLLRPPQDQPPAQGGE